MPPKKEYKKQRKSSVKKDDRPPAFQQPAEVICFYHGPGPKYKLKPVLGYKDHCPSKHRNPAWSILGKRRPEIEEIHPSPGPKYLPIYHRPPGLSMGLPIKYIKTRDLTPGPYTLPDHRPGPAFSMGWRTGKKSSESSPGPYNLPRNLNGPSFTIGTRITRVEELHLTPSPRLTNVDFITPRAPAFSLQFKRRDPAIAVGTPGPYDPVETDKGPAFTFGVKHHPCTFPYITPCDKLF